MIAFAAGCGRLLRAVVVLALAGGLLLVAAGLGLAWRVGQGPLDVAWAARLIEGRVNAPDAPTRLRFGHAAIRWAGYVEGEASGLEILLGDVVLADRDGRPIAAIASLDATLSMARLLVGQLVPRAVAATGLELHLLRDSHGDTTLDLGGTDLGADDPGDDGPSITDIVAELARPAGRVGASQAASLPHLEQLRRIHLAGATLHLKDAALARTARLAIATLDLVRQSAGGVRGGAAATLALGSAQAALSVQAELAPEGGTRLQLALAPIAASAVQQAAPGLAPPGAMEAAIQASATLLLDPGLRPTGAAIHVQAGTGTVRVAGAPIGFDSLLLDAEAGWDAPGWTRPTRLAIPRTQAVIHAPGGAWPTTIAATARLRQQDNRLLGEVTIDLDHLAFADLPAVWPERLGGHTRPWLTQNITAGTARDAHLHATFEGPADFDPAHPAIALTTIDGSLTGEDATIHWLRPVPPIEHAQAVLTIKSPEYLDIAIPTARQGALALTNGQIHISGLNVKDQFLGLSANAAGPVAELIALLRQPGLHLLDRKPIPMRNPSGAMSGQLAIDLPLNHDLRFDQVRIETSGRFTDLRLGALAGGRDLDRGDVRLEATAEALKATGTALVGTVPAEIAVEMDFRDGPPSQVVQRARLFAARATPMQLAAAGVDPGGLMPGGTGQFTATYTERRDRSSDLAVTADLRDAALAAVGWRKAPGAPATASARLLLRGDRLLGIEDIHAQGPGMAIDGRVQMVGDRPLILALDRLVLGPTQAQGQLRFPAASGEPIRATLNGPVLDLSTQLSAPPGRDAGPAWIADIAFARLLLAGDRGLDAVTAHAESDGRRITALQAASTGPERLQAAIRRDGTGRRVQLRSVDGGAVLRAFDVLDTVRGGDLVLDAVYDDTKPGSPLSGTAGLTGFQVDKAAALGKLLQAITIYGLVDALNGQGVAFSQLTLPFRWDNAVLEIAEARAFSASLGVTARGRIDTSRHTIDVQGTVVPAYVVNSLLGRIPLLGRLFSAEQGGGLVAVNYTMRGATADPAIIVNPLSALTPGFLRGLFHILD